MKKIGKLFGKVVVIGDKNEVKPNQLLVTLDTHANGAKMIHTSSREDTGKINTEYILPRIDMHDVKYIKIKIIRGSTVYLDDTITINKQEVKPIVIPWQDPAKAAEQMHSTWGKYIYITFYDKNMQQVDPYNISFLTPNASTNNSGYSSKQPFVQYLVSDNAEYRAGLLWPQPTSYPCNVFTIYTAKALDGKDTGIKLWINGPEEN